MSCNKGAHEAVAALKGVGVPAAETMAVYGNRSVGMTWEYLPRCPRCKRWVSPRTGICNYAKCPGKGTQVVDPPGWPPDGARVVGSKKRAAAALEDIRLTGYGHLADLPPLGGLTNEEMETIFEEAAGSVPAEVAAEDEARWRDEAARFLEFAAEHGVMLPVSGREMTREEARGYAALGRQVSYPEDILAEATDIVDDALAEDDFEPVADEPPAAMNLNDHRIDPEADALGRGGPKQKYRGNVAAIRLLRQLEAEDRQATDEEKKVLAGYVGWGGLAKAFDPYEGYAWNTRATWGDEYRELKELLPAEEYESARATTPNAHYTSATVIQGMWQGLERLGFTGGNVLEPAAGVGHFYGLMPEEMTHRSTRTAIELDDLTGRILSKLYPDADVHVAGYENTAVAPNSIDVAVGNVPFGDYGVYDPDFDTPAKRYLSSRIHNYFFARTLKDVKPGGVVAFVTSHHTLDAKNPQVRQYLAGQADLLGAVRLPNTAFKGNAGTEVTTDIIFLRKRMEGEEPGDTSWLDSVMVEAEGRYGTAGIAMNKYFADHPEMMLGDISAAGSMYGSKAELTVNAPEGQDLAAALDEAIGRLPKDALTVTPRERCRACGAFMSAAGCNNPMCPDRRASRGPDVKVRAGAKVGALLVKGGKVYRLESGGVAEVKTKGDQAERIAGILGIRDQARKTLDLMRQDTSDADLAMAQAELSELYDKFVGKYGPIHARKNLRLLKGEPDLPFLVALEEQDGDGWRKAAFFSKRTMQAYKPPEHVDTAKDALLVVLNETGGLEWGRMAALTGKGEAALQHELMKQGLIFKDPSGAFVTAEEYLSGNVRDKLAAAEAAARLAPAMYADNVEALRQALPETVPYTDIKAQLGAAWIPADYVTRFVRDRMGVRGVTVNYLDSSGEFVLEKDRWFSRHSVANETTWGAGGLDGMTLLKRVLDGRTPKVYDKLDDGKRILNQDATLAAREAADKIKAEFEAWVWEDEGRQADLEERFNRIFNSDVPRQFNGAHLVLPGMTNEITLRPHQKDAIWQISRSQDNVLLGHIVGAGKTFSMIGGAMEYRRLHGGTAMHVVPNHMLDQFSADVQRMYPGAKVLAVSARDIGKKEKRAEVMNRIATGDWAAVVVTHDAFNRIPMKPETEASFMKEEIRQLEQQMHEMRAAGESKRTVKQIEKAMKRLEVKLKRAMARQAKDDYGLTFEDLGIGIMNVDEAHLYKNLEVHTRRDRLAGIPQGGSARAWDMFMKTQYLSRRCKCGRFVGADGVCRRCLAGTDIVKGKVVFATGTPIANSMAEAYVMQKMLMYDKLKEKGLHHFDAWANMFGTTQTAMELKPSGDGYREYTRWAKFHNVPELMRLFRTVADIKQDPDALGLERPDLVGGEPEGVSVPTSEWLEAFIADCGERAENLHHVDPTEDNMLKIVSDARKAALDPRLIDPTLPDDPNSKVNAAVRNILRIHEESTGVDVPGVAGKQDMAQMVFLDMYRSEGHNVYDDLKAKLVAGGIPEHEIAFIHDAKNDAQKLALFNKVNAGQVRVLIGSTMKMGTGTNAQKRLMALHHLDAPWRPADVEQREGRILRWGNMNGEVKINRYVTEGSFDTYMWQTLQTKARFIAQLMNNPDNPLREIEDLDAMVIGYAQMKALATGNPIIIEQIELETQRRKLKGLRRAYINRQREIAREIRATEAAMTHHRQNEAKWRVFMAAARPPLSSFEIELGGKRRGSKDKKEAGKVFAGLIEAYSNTTKRGVVGTMNGYKIRLKGLGKGRAPECEIEYKPGLVASFNLGADSTRNMTRLMNRVNDYPAQAVDEYAGYAAKREADLAQYRTAIEVPFEQEEEFKRVEKRLNEIDIEMAAMKKEEDAIVLRSTEEGGGKEVVTGEAADSAARMGRDSTLS